MVAQYRDTEMTATEEDVEFRKTYRPPSAKTCQKWERAPNTFCVPKYGWPTEAPPGTIEKLLVMTARASRDESVFHPSDALHEGDLRPLLFYLAKCEDNNKGV